MYRAVTLYCMRNDLFDVDGNVNTEALQAAMPDVKVSFKFNEETGRPDTYLNGERVEDIIRSIEVSNNVRWARKKVS